VQNDGVVHQVQEVGLFDWDSGTVLRRIHIQIPLQSEAGIVLNGNIQSSQANRQIKYNGLGDPLFQFSVPENGPRFRGCE
jgi:hypothetical protein